MRTTTTNLINTRGNKVTNQFVITQFDNNGLVKQITFQSYNSIVCEIVPNCGMGYDCLIRFGRDYDYSNTTMKHLKKFLSDYPVTRELQGVADVRRAIEKGHLRDEAIAVIFDSTLY